MNAIVEIINAAGQRFVASALPMLIQSGVLILILLAVNLVLRRKVRAIFRYWIWMLVLVKLMLPPSLGSPVSVGTWFGDRLEVSPTALFEPEEPPITEAPTVADNIMSRPVPTFVAPPPPTTETPARQPAPPADETVVKASPPASQIKEAVPAPRPGTTLTWQGLVLLFWSAAVAALLLLLLQRAFFVQGLVAQAEEPTQALLNALQECRDRIALRGPVALKVSPNASSPAVCGLWNPVILIPHNLAPKLHGRDLQAVLLHELAHVKRGDLWINLAQTLLQIVYFYNPLLWLANAAIRRVREQAVDETVLVAMGETARHYPETLLHVAKLAFHRRPVLSLRLIGVVESKSALSGRIKHILNRPIPKTARLGLLGLLVIVLVAAVMLPMAKARPMTDRARDVLALAEEEARTLNHKYIGTEHILVALSRRSDAVSAQVLENLGVGADTLRTQMRTLVTPGAEPSPAGKLPQTALAKQTLKRATDEARSLGHDYIGTEHLLLALMRDRESVAAQMLHGLGLTAPQIRVEILKLVRPGRMDASQPDTEDRASSPFVTTLPNGVTVELLGVCEHPSQGRQWWRPDGSPLEEIPYDRIDGKASPDENEAAFELAVRVLDLPEGAETQMKADPATSTSGGSSPAFKDTWQLDELRWLVAEFPAAQQTCTIRVGVAAGPWQTVVRSSGREAVVEWTSQGSIEFSKARQDAERGACITVTDHMPDQTSRVVAVTVEGRLERPWHSGASSSHGVRQTSVDFPELSLADVREFLFQTRAWTWVEFKNVSLRPGRGAKDQAPAASPEDQPATRSVVPSASADADGDGLSDFQEVHKYLTDPTKKDSDGDGTPDGDWDERREYAYSIRTVLRYLPPLDDGGLNGDFQDARVLEQTDNYVEIEVVHYPLATSHESIPENPNWRQDYARMSEYLAPGPTTNWDEQMKRDLLAELKADGVDVETLTDKQVVEQVSRWLMKRSRSLDKVFTTFYVYCPDGRPQVYPGLEEAFQNEFNRDSGNYDWPIEQHFDHELLGKGMFYNKTHGSCTSVAVYLTTALRALGIPTRMVLVTPAVDASDREQILMVKSALTHNRVRTIMLAGLSRSSRGFTNHTFNEVYVGGRWCRLDYHTLGCPIFGAHRFGLQTHVYTFNDLSDINLAATWGVRYARGERNDIFKHSNPYTAVEISERFGAHGNIANPPFSAQEFSSSPLPNIFVLYPSGVNVWDELVEIVQGRTWDKTGRPHAREHYENLFEGVWLTKPGDILVLLFSLDTPERVPQGYEDLLPKPWPEIESQLKQGQTVELSTKARDMNVILLAAPTKDELKPLVRNSKLLRAPGTSTEEQGNRPAGPGPPRSAHFAVRVNENVEIELLGICDHPSEGRPWWRPDGSPMEAAPYRTTGSRLDHMEGYQDYEFALRVSGPRDTAIAWIVPGGSRGSDTGRAQGADGKTVDVHAYTSNQSADSERANVFIGVAGGAWETCAVHKTLASEGSYTLEDNKAIAFGIAYVKGSETFVPVTTNLKSKEANRRLIAVDVNGEQHVAGGSGYGGNILHSSTCRFDMPLDQIRELRFQRRPYTWVAYTPVSLRPGQATDVTIKLLDTDSAMAQSRRAPGQEKVCGIGPAWEALKDRVGKRYGGTIGGFSTDEKRCREYFAQVLSWTALGDTLVLMLAFDQSAAIPPQYADLLPLPWPEIESRIKKGELVEAQGSARNLNVVLLAAPTLTQLNALVQQTHLLDAFRTETAKQLKSSPEATPATETLELRIAPKQDALAAGIVEACREALVEDRPVPGGTFVWFELRPEIAESRLPPGVVTGSREGKAWLLLWNTEPHAMLAGQGWGLEDVYETTDANGRSAIKLTLDEEGARLFYELTRANVRRPLAIVLDGRVVSLPEVLSPLVRQALIVGNFTGEEIRQILASLRAGMRNPPASQPSGQTAAQTEVNPPPTDPGPLGRHALSFDGVDDCLIVPASPSLTLKPPFFVEVWAKPDFSVLPERMVGRIPDEELWPEMDLMRQGGPLPATTAVQTEGPQDDGSAEGLGEGWPEYQVRPAHGLAGVQAGGFMGFLRGRSGGVFAVGADGRPAQMNIVRTNQLAVDRPGWTHFYVAQDQIGTPYVPSEGPLVIGRILPNGFPFKGQIAEIRIWNKMLPVKDTHYWGSTFVTGNEPNLVACWTFEEGSGPIVRDISPNANHAHLGKSDKTDAGDPKWVDLAQNEASAPSGLGGRLVDADGKGVAGAQVAVCTEEIGVTILNGRLSQPRPGDTEKGQIVETDAQGRFRFEGQTPADFSLIAAHDDGFALVESDAFRWRREVRTLPWGGIEGYLASGRRALEDKIWMSGLPNSTWRKHKCDFRYETKCDGQGRFVFERVPAGRFEVGYLASTGGGSASVTSRTPVVVESGRIAKMKLGGEGRPVLGKLVPPEGYHGPIYFGQGLRALSTSRPEEPRPENYDRMTRREQQAWHKQWRDTPEAKAFYEAMWSNPKWRQYCFSIQEDGSFRIVDVIPGTYNLNIWLEERFTGQGRPEEIAGYYGTVEVPAMAEASTDEPLDLGELTLSMRHPLHVGDTVPAFEAETLDGKAIRLADYRGRYVLLSFWSPTFHPELNRLKELHAEYGKTGQLQIIGLGGTDTQDEVTSYISEHDIPWPQVYFGPDWKADLFKKLGGQMQIILIDPDGKIIATWLRGEDLTDTVRNALEEAERADRVSLQIDCPEPGPAQYDSLGAVPRRTVLTDERPVVLVPRDVANVARGKPVTLSNPSYLTLGEAEYVTDGDKRPMYFVEFEPESFRPHSGANVTIDLEREYEIHAVAWWHDFHRPAVYLDVVVQVARDPQFKDAVTLYSNDRDDSLGLGIGDDLNYIETNKGWLADADGVLGRYVRLWNRGNSRNMNAQYTEVEVYGRLPR